MTQNATHLASFRLAVAIRSALVRLSQSAAGSAYLKRRIEQATADVERAQAALRRTK